MKKLAPAREVPQPATGDTGTDELPSEIRRTKGGELLVWAPRIKSEVRPLVTLGRFRDGTPAIHLRRYRVRGDGDAVMTNEGATFRVDEMVELIERLRAVFAVIPSLRSDTELTPAKIGT